MIDMPGGLPSLPPGYSAQETWGFRDARGLSYTFCNVYGPPEGEDQRGPVCHLDEARSYWAVLWRAQDANSGDHPTGRCITFKEARSEADGHLTFRRFSSPLGMRDEIPRLLHASDIAVQLDPAAMTNGAQG